MACVVCVCALSCFWVIQSSPDSSGCSTPALSAVPTAVAASSAAAVATARAHFAAAESKAGLGTSVGGGGGAAADVGAGAPRAVQASRWRTGGGPVDQVRLRAVSGLLWCQSIPCCVDYFASFVCGVCLHVRLFYHGKIIILLRLATIGSASCLHMAMQRLCAASFLHAPSRNCCCTQGALEARLKAAADEHTTMSQRERDMFTEDLGPVFGSGPHVRLCRVVVGGTVEGEERLHISATVWILAVWRYGVHLHGTCCP